MIYDPRHYELLFIREMQDIAVMIKFWKPYISALSSLHSQCLGF